MKLRMLPQSHLLISFPQFLLSISLPGVQATTALLPSNGSPSTSITNTASTISWFYISVLRQMFLNI